MTNLDRQVEVIRYWIEKSQKALESAQLELNHDQFTFAVNRIYYASFYIVSALLLSEGKRFVKHTGVRAAFHKDYIKTGMVDKKWGEFYDQVFEDRQEGDYLELVVFEKEEINDSMQKAKQFVEIIKGLIKTH